MKLGKMGIQICEKLREKLGWRQIALCHKWDGEAGYCAIREPERHARGAQSVNQRAKALPRLVLRDRSTKTSDELFVL